MAASGKGPILVAGLGGLLLWLMLGKKAEASEDRPKDDQPKPKDDDGPVPPGPEPPPPNRAECQRIFDEVDGQDNLSMLITAADALGSAGCGDLADRLGSQIERLRGICEGLYETGRASWDPILAGARAAELRDRGCMQMAEDLQALANQWQQQLANCSGMAGAAHNSNDAQTIALAIQRIEQGPPIPECLVLLGALRAHFQSLTGG